MERPVLPDGLKEKLDVLREGGCSGHYDDVMPRVSCIVDEAKDILDRVGKVVGEEGNEVGVEKKSTWGNFCAA